MNEGTLRLELRVKNARMHRAIIEKYGSLKQMCKQESICYPTVINMVGLKLSPWCKDGVTLRSAAKQVLDALDLPVGYVFLPDLYEQDVIPSETLVAEVDHRRLLPETEAMGLLAAAPDEAMQERMDWLDKALSTLTPREEQVLRMRYGLTEEHRGRVYTYAEISDVFNLTVERMRQVEKKAKKKLAHPVRAKSLKELVAELEST